MGLLFLLLPSALIVEAGPLDPKGQHDYIIVTDPTASFLSVQARDPVLFEKNYHDEVIVHLVYYMT